MPGRPIAASSATVEAPERDTTRWLAAMRAGRSVKNGATSAATCSLRVGVADARQVLVARLLHDLQPHLQTRLEPLDRGRHDIGHHARALAAAEHQELQRPARRRAADRASPPPRSPPAAPDCRCASPWRRAPGRGRERRQSRSRSRARAAPASGWRGPSPRSARGSRVGMPRSAAASSGGMRRIAAEADDHRRACSRGSIEPGLEQAVAQHACRSWRARPDCGRGWWRSG